jgi:hypothetical protein
MTHMGDVVELAGWGSRRGGVPSDRTAAGARPAMARVRPILREWHPSAGPAVPPAEAASAGDPANADEPIRRLDRAVGSIDEIISKISCRGAGLGSNVETELLALVGEISLGLIDAAADRAERLASGLGGAASSGP